MNPTAAARVIAFHLPQFYPTPENDRWWGPGFTEWSSVAAARPLFPGHQQPRIPGELGFYDLRSPDTRAEQAELAAEHGIEAFCYWHYWFGGTRLLERPVEEILRTREPDFGFCLGWANQAWTRTWLGSGEVLMDQPYSIEDDVAHGRFLAGVFADARYVRIEGRPLFAVYRPADLPDPERTCETWREVCSSEGVGDPLLVGVNAFCPGVDMRAQGFDLMLDFQPALGRLPHAVSTALPPLGRVRRNLRLGVRDPRLTVFDDAEARRLMNRRDRLGYPTIPAVMVGWDNTPRRGRRAIVLLNSTDASLRRSLDDAVGSVADLDLEHRLVFVNAWNEWGEGNYLEPDRTDGRARLEAVAAAVLHSG